MAGGVAVWRVDRIYREQVGLADLGGVTLVHSEGGRRRQVHGPRHRLDQDRRIVRAWELLLLGHRITTGAADGWQHFVGHPALERLGFRLAAREDRRVQARLVDRRNPAPASCGTQTGDLPV